MKTETEVFSCFFFFSISLTISVFLLVLQSLSDVNVIFTGANLSKVFLKTILSIIFLDPFSYLVRFTLFQTVQTHRFLINCKKPKVCINISRVFSFFSFVFQR